MSRNNSLSVVRYISIKYILSSFSKTTLLNSDSKEIIKDFLGKFKLNNISLVIIDMSGIRFNSIEFDISNPKKSILFFTFNDFSSNHNVDFLFINGSKDVSLNIIEKDFPKQKNIFILSYLPDYYFLHSEITKRPSISDIETRWNYLHNFSFLESFEKCQLFIDELISYRLKYLLVKHHCIQEIEAKDHVLRSTPVHVNKYINLKPIIENHAIFDEICYYLSDRITEKFCIPDFIVASSKNSISLASGLLKYLKTTDIIIINQVSPITAFNNYSNINEIKSNARYAIVEDFHCMGTEIKVLKGILWSHGVNVDEDVYAFPVASTKIYDNDYPVGTTGLNIFPLYKIEEEFNYKMFTYNTCPVCNDIHDCEHRKLFNFKS